MAVNSKPEECSTRRPNVMGGIATLIAVVGGASAAASNAFVTTPALTPNGSSKSQVTRDADVPRRSQNGRVVLEGKAGPSVGSSSSSSVSACTAALLAVAAVRTAARKRSSRTSLAAYVGEGMPAEVCAKKDRCYHPDKPAMFACADCPRRGGMTGTAEAEFDGQLMSAAAYVGEGMPAEVCAKKDRCLHPDKPMMFACADCPRRGGMTGTAEAELDGQCACAAAAYVGEGMPAEVCAKKDRCVHPDKPMMFACADCPRRGGMTGTAEAEFDGQLMSAAAYVGEGMPAEVCAKKDRCVHPDKPMMFACADCPRRGGMTGTAEAEFDGQLMSAAAYVGEGMPAEVCAKKDRCVHPDKPMMFACADCPRRGAMVGTAEAEFDGQLMSAAAYVGEGMPAEVCACAEKDRCVHPDKPAN